MSSASDFAFVIARITKDANLRKNSNGSYSAFVPLAEHENYTDRNGNHKQITNFLSARAYLTTDKQAKFYKKLTKGKLVKIQGKLQGHSWKSNGQYHYRQDFVPDLNGITFFSPVQSKDNKPVSTKQAPQSSAPQSSASVQSNNQPAQPASSNTANNASDSSQAPKSANTKKAQANAGGSGLDLDPKHLPF